MFDPATWTLIRDFGLPLVGLVVVGVVLYRTLMGVIEDLRRQRDAATARTDALIAGLAAQTEATKDLTTLVREGFSRKGT